MIAKHLFWLVSFTVWSFCVEFVAYQKFRFFFFSSLRSGSASQIYWKHAPSWFRAFINCFIKPKIYSGGKLSSLYQQVVHKWRYVFRLLTFHTWVRGHSKSTFAQDSQVLTLPPPPPLFTLVCFQAPPPLQGTLVLARTHLSPSISILVKFREKKLIMSTSIFGWTQHVF